MGKQKFRMHPIGLAARGRGRALQAGRGATGDTTACSQTSSSSPTIQSALNAETIGPLASSPLQPQPSSVEPQPLQTQPPTNTDSNPPISQPHPVITKKRKGPAYKSPLWAYFTRCTIPNLDEIDPDWCSCNICGEEVLCARTNGTSSMWAHVNNRCLNHPMSKKREINDLKQSRLVLDNITGAAKSHKYNKKRVDEKFIAMIIKDELPFRFAEKEGFREFMREALPEWPIMSRKQVAKGVFELYFTEKALLMSALKAANTRISITTDTWTSIQNINYMVITAHFMDNDWVLHKRIISFCPILSHKGEDIGKAVYSCLRDWEITKVFTITVDNASANDVAVQHIKRNLRMHKTLMFNGDYMHLRCACHIINLIVKDGLKELEHGIQAIWNCAKYVRSSASRLEKFRQFAVEEHLNPKANVPLDVVTRWNSTYLMLEAALKFEIVFARMADDDPAFVSYFQDRVGPPKDDDWRSAEAFCIFLKKFYESTVKLSAWKSVSSNILLVEMVSLQTEIDKACSSDDSTLRRVGVSMREKFNKYWGSFEVVNKIIMVANVLDPRYKLRWAKVAMEKVNASPILIENIEKDLKAILMKMYDEYRTIEGEEIPEEVAGSELDEEDFEGLDDVSIEMSRQLATEQNVCIKNEVDQYLNDRLVSLATRKPPAAKKFDIAKWWKINECQYPVLSKLAKDLFAIPSSTVASENAFSLGSRVVDPFRSSLTLKMVEALVCTSDWLRGEPLNLEKDPTEDELALYTEMEEIEKEYAVISEAGLGVASGNGGRPRTGASTTGTSATMDLGS